MKDEERYKYPPRYWHNAAMSPEEQFNWITEQAFRDPHWAQTEADIRRLAVEIQNRLMKSGHEETVSVSIPRYDERGYMGVRYEGVSFMLTRLGVAEELLLIEEQLRRAMRAK